MTICNRKNDMSIFGKIFFGSALVPPINLRAHGPWTARVPASPTCVLTAVKLIPSSCPAPSIAAGSIPAIMKISIPSGGEFRISHSHCSHVRQASQSPDAHLGFQVILTKLYHPFRGVNIVFAIEDCFFKLLWCKRSWEVKRHGCFLHRQAKVSFNRFQR